MPEKKEEGSDAIPSLPDEISRDRFDARHSHPGGDREDLREKDPEEILAPEGAE